MPAARTIEVGHLAITGPEGRLGVDAGLPWVQAEQVYAVRDARGLPLEPGLGGALTVVVGAGEGRLRFGNFVGVALVGGEPLDVRSDRLAAGEVESMLSDVLRDLAGIPAQASSPSGAAYDRGRSPERDADYLAYLVLRDAMLDARPLDLRAALERIVARPHERLAHEPRTVPVWALDRVDGRTLLDLVTSPDDRVEVAPGAPLWGSPVAVAMRGSLPRQVPTSQARPTTDTLENRFVVHLLERATDVCRSVAVHARLSPAASVVPLAAEAERLARAFERVRRSQALAAVPASSTLPTTSTVLRGRPGYRDVLRVWGELLGRARLLPPSASTRLVGLRNAAAIYEQWCFFRVVDAVAAALGGAGAASVRRTWEGPTIDADLAVAFPEHDVRVWFNRSFSQRTKGFRSYSLVLRPDILIEVGGDRHVFDAKLAFDGVLAAVEDDEDDSDEVAPVRRARRHHIQKMHTYRDALDRVRSVRVLYPGTKDEFHRVAAGSVDGVGALGLRPGAPAEGVVEGLNALVTQLLRDGDRKEATA